MSHELHADVAAVLQALRHPSRRDFLLTALTGLWVAALACDDSKEVARPPVTSHPPVVAPRAAPLSASQHAVLDQVTARILPSDDGPGAREAGVSAYIANQITGELARFRPALGAMLDLLERTAQERYQAGFARLGSGQQDALIGDLAHARLSNGALPERDLFLVMHTLTLEGFLCDPRHGGNRDHVAWSALGVPVPHAH